MMAAAGAGGDDGYELWSWGQNGIGGWLGLGDETFRSSPVQVGDSAVWAKIAKGSGDSNGTHCVGIQSDGSLWAWGSGGSGRLGDGSATNRLAPVQVGSATNWVECSVGKDHSAAIDADGKLYTWGDGAKGATGHNSTTDYNVPTQVGSLTNWATVALGDDTSLSVKTDGTLWAWGKATEFLTGLNTETANSSPIQVGSATNWLRPSCGGEFAGATKTDGSIWTWGNRQNGRLGDGNDSGNTQTPAQMGSATDWAVFSAGGKHGAAITTDGKLYTWGYGNAGRLGHGNTTNLSAPTQVGSLTTWADVHTMAPTGTTLAVKTDGTLWAWGYNAQGQLGIGSTTVQSSPVQVGSLTTWVVVSGSDKHSFGLKSA